MGIRELAKANKFNVFKNFIIFNLAGVIGFILGTVSFAVSMFVFLNPTFSWLFANVIGGISHFSANHVMQRHKREEIVKNFIVFNATGIAGFIIATATFAGVILYLQNSSIAWLFGSFAGTSSHFMLNHKAMKLRV